MKLNLNYKSIRLDEYPYPGSEDKTPSWFDPVRTVFGFIFTKIFAFLGYFKPSYLKKQWQNLQQKTWFEIVSGFFKIIFHSAYLSVWSIYYVNRIMLRFVLKLMLGEYGYVDEEEELLVDKAPTPYSMIDVPPRPALMSAEDVENTRASISEPIQPDEGIVEDISRLQFKLQIY